MGHWTGGDAELGGIGTLAAFVALPSAAGEICHRPDDATVGDFDAAGIFPCRAVTRDAFADDLTVDHIQHFLRSRRSDLHIVHDQTRVLRVGHVDGLGASRGDDDGVAQLGEGRMAGHLVGAQAPGRALPSHFHYRQNLLRSMSSNAILSFVRS